MENNYIKEFEQLKPKFFKFFVLEAICFVAICVLVFNFPEIYIFGSSTQLIFIVLVTITSIAIYRHFAPRCPKCNYGVYSVVEIGNYPIIVKSWVGKRCFHCGAQFKN